MAYQRWAIRSLRRFQDHEIILNFYFSVGGLLSLIYMASAILRSRIYAYVFSVHLFQNYAAVLHVAKELVAHSVLRGLFWLPQLIYELLHGNLSLWDWITASSLLKDMSI